MDGNQQIQQQLYRQEVEILLGDLKTALGRLEGQPDNQEIIGRIYRVMHTFRGSGWRFGYTDLSDLARYLESLYEQARERTRTVTPQLVEASRSALDLMNQMLECGDGVVDEERKTAVIGTLLRLVFVPGERQAGK